MDYSTQGNRSLNTANRPTLNAQAKAVLFAILLSFTFISRSFAQIVGDEGVFGNFGVDAGFYANQLENGTFSVPATGTDDWFYKFPGQSGQGVIDTVGAARLRDSLSFWDKARRNYTFTKGMSQPINSIVNGNRWLDAVYGRDNNSAGGNRDSSVFTSGADKNFFNPRKWTLGGGGSPAKNDIIDVTAHLRRVGTSLTGTLWGYASATTVSPNGASHVDFEYFRENITFVANANVFTGSPGVDSGHTAWKFSADGRVLQPGDVIISFDFEDGGTNPVATVRIWIDPASLPYGGFAGFNANATDPPFKFTGVFDGDNNQPYKSLPYGYAEINALDGGTEYIFARVNRAEETIEGTPWGCLAGPQASFVSDAEPFLFTEFAINLSAFGLDAPTQVNDPCAQLFGALLVKTRSSPSFTSELKDFAGPYAFGRKLEAKFTLSASTLSCANTTATSTLSNMSPPAPATTIVWSGAGLTDGQGTTQATWSSGGWKYVTVTLNGTQCSKTDSVFISGNVTPPNVDAGGNKTLTCSTTQVKLNGSSTTPNAQYEWSGPGIVGSNTVAEPNVSATGTYTLKVTNPANGCTASDDVTVNEDRDAPNVDAGGNKTLTCTTTEVKLNGSSTTPNAQYLWSGPGIVGSNTIAEPNASATGTYTLKVTDPSNGCTASDDVSVNENRDKPNVDAGGNKTLTCSTTEVKLNGSSTTPNAEYLWSGPGIVGSNTVAEPNVSATGTYTLKVTNPANGCTASDDVTVNENKDKPNVDAGGNKTLTCSTTQVKLNGSSTTPNAQYEWSGPGIVGSNTVAEPNVSATGTYTLKVTDPSNGCTASDDVTVNENRENPDVDAGDDKEISCNELTATLTGSSSTPNAQFLWSTNDGNFVSNNSNVAVVDKAGTYTLKVTNPANGCTASESVNVTKLDDKPKCDLEAPQYLPLANSTGNKLSTSASGYNTIVWSLTSSDGNWQITGGQGTTEVTYKAGGAGSYGTFKVVLASLSGECKDSCMVTFYAASGEGFCSLTQGFYGNYGGKYCDGRTTLQLVTDLLQTPLVIGKTGVRSLTFAQGNADCVIQRLPGGGPAAILPPTNANQLPADMTFTSNCNTTPFTVPTKNGRFRNILLAQTITLGLNLRLGTPLAQLKLTGPYLITGAQEGGGCIDANKQIVPGSEQYHSIPQSVLNYLGPNGTVQDLFNLANLCLAGQAPNGVDITSVGGAAGTINEAFDECRKFIGFTDIQPTVFKSDKEGLGDMDEIYDESLNLDATVSVYPNPFGDATNIEYMLTQTSNLKVEVLDATGRVVNTLFNGVAQEDTPYTMLFNASGLSNGIYVVRFVSDNVSVQKKIILQR